MKRTLEQRLKEAMGKRERLVNRYIIPVEILIIKLEEKIQKQNESRNKHTR
jgi:hypothetical protein